MKLKFFAILFIIIFFAGILFLITRLPTIPTKFRSLRIEIVDAITKKPISDINIYYELEVAGPNNFLGISLIDPINFRYVKLEKHKSNLHGLVNIKNKLTFLKLYEKIFRERVYVNLEIESNDSDYKKQAEKFITKFEEEKLVYPNKKYRGMIIYSGTDKKNIKKEVIRNNKYDLIILDGINLESKDDVIITVEISRKNGKI